MHQRRAGRARCLLRRERRRCRRPVARGAARRRGWNCEAENGSLRSSFHSKIGRRTGMADVLLSAPMALRRAPRLAEAVALVRDKRQAPSRWHLAAREHPPRVRGTSPSKTATAWRAGGTLRALRVLHWYDDDQPRPRRLGAPGRLAATAVGPGGGRWTSPSPSGPVCVANREVTGRNRRDHPLGRQLQRAQRPGPGERAVRLLHAEPGALVQVLDGLVDAFPVGPGPKWVCTVFSISA